uniref:Putative ovule protein n=1 Tax=Solanum chacoense TaxID=4108 RepID=A0A0V0GFC7_SOLCH
MIFGCSTEDKKLSSQSKQFLSWRVSLRRSICFSATTFAVVRCSAFHTVDDEPPPSLHVSVYSPIVG